jgi:hypothetical protein
MKIKLKIETRIFLGWLFYIVGIVGGLYVGGWLMFIKPIMEACQHFDAGTLTGMIVGATVLKCLFANPIGLFIAYMGVTLGNILDY